MASNFSIKLSVSTTQLLKSIQDAIRDINNKDKLKSNRVNVKANDKTLIKSIKDAIKAASEELEKSESGKVKIGVNSTTLTNSIINSVKAFNQKADAGNKTVKLTADLDITAALKRLQAQLAKNNLVTTNVSTDSTAKTTDTEKQKKVNTDSLISSIKQKTEAEREYVQLTLDSYSKEIESEKQRELAAKNTTVALNAQNKVLETGNDLLRQRTNYADAQQKTPTSRATTYGNGYNNITYREVFNAEEQAWRDAGSSIVSNVEKLDKANAKAYSTILDLGVELDKIEAKYKGEIGNKGIDKTSEAFKRLEAEGENIRNMFDKIAQASGTARDRLIADARAAIKEYDLSVAKAQNANWKGSTLRIKDVPTHKEIYANELDTLMAKLVSSHVPAEILINDFKSLREQLDKVNDSTSLTGFQNNLDIFKAKAQTLSVIFKELNGSMEKLNSASGVVNSSGFNGTFGAETVGSLNSQITTLTDKLNTLKTAMTNAKSPETVQENIIAYNQVEKEVTDIVNAVTQLKDLSAGANDITNKLSNILNPAIFKRNGSNEKVVEVKKQIAELDTECRKFLADLGKDVTPEGLNKSAQILDVLQTKFASLRTYVGGLKNDLQQTNIDQTNLRKYQELIANIDDYARKNNKAMSKINPNTGLTYGEDFNKIKQAAEAATVPVEQLRNQTAMLQAQIKSAGMEGQTFFSELMSKAGKFLKWTGMTLAITKARMYFRQLFTTVYSLDEALVDLKKTFTGTDEELNQFYYDSNKLAKQLGVTTKEIIEQGSAWSRLGYSSKESMETMAKMSSMFAAISPDMNTEEATNGLVSIMKAFKIDPNKVLDDVLSKVNIIGNTAATSNGEIVEMLKRSSAAMREGNNTLEETIALETAAVEVVRDAPSVGVAYKTISARLRGLDEETLEVIDDMEILTGKIADATKTANNPGGISIFTDSSRNTYKSTYQIIKEIAEIWDDLTDVQHAKLGDILGGKRQLQIVSATIDNFEAAEKALKNMANSAGNAEAEMSIVRESAAYALNEMKETFTELSQNAVSRGELKALIKTGTALLDIVNGIVKGVGAIPALLGTIFGIIGTKSKMLLNFNKGTGKFNLFGMDLGKGWFSNLREPARELKAITSITNDLQSSTKGTALSMGTMNKVMKTSSDELKALVKYYNRGYISGGEFTTKLDEMSKGLKKTNSAAAILKNGIKSLGATIASISASMAMAWAIGKVIEWFTSMINYTEECSEKAEDFSQKAKSIEDQIVEVNDELATTKLRIDELNAIENPTIIEQEELDKLIEVNEELERLKKSLIAQQKDNARQAADATVEWWKTINVLDSDGGWEGFKQGIGRIKVDHNNETANDFGKAIIEYRDLQKEIAEINKKMDETTDESYILKLKEQLDELNEKQKEAQNIAEHNYAIWTAKVGMLNLDIPEQKEIYEHMYNYIIAWEKAIGKYDETNRDLVDILNDSTFTVVKKELIALWKQGKLTTESFRNLTNESVDGINAFREALENSGHTDFEEVIRAICRYFEKTEEKVDDATTAVKNFEEALGKVQDALDKFVSLQEKLNETFKKLKLGGTLTRDEIYDLVKQMPAISEYLNETAEGWVISAEGIKKASDELAETEKKSLQDKIDALQKSIDTIGQFVALENEAEYSLDPDSVRNRDDYKELYEKAQQIRTDMNIESTKEWSEVLSDLGSEMSGFVFLMDLVDDKFSANEQGIEGLKERYEEFKNEISDFNTQIQTIDSAINTLNKDTLLSYDELNALLDIDPNLEYENNGDRYSVSIEALEELRKKSYETRNARIEDMKAVVKAEINANTDLKAEYEKNLEKIGTMGVTEESLKALADTTKNLDGVNGELDYLYELLKRLDGLQQNLTTDNGDGNDLSDKLQKQIDHYKSIIEAVTIVRDKYVEAIDNEIDGLNDVKDALKDANDERERELKLQEAANDLENAKKRKVYVFKDGTFQQVQDQKAVKEAEEKYRDAITDVQEAEIDKAIKERENKKEAIDDKIKDLINAEGNIRNAMVVSQAMKEYGLTDAKELLNLSDDVKQGIIEGLADSTLQKDIEDNKENTEYTTVTLQSLLKELGSTKNIDDIEPSVFNNMGKISKDNAIKGFTDKLKNDAQARIDNVTYNNAPVINANFTITNADDPQAVAETVQQELGNFLRQYCDSIK